jgi:hypothetical protein
VSSLRQYQNNPKHLISTALQMFRSKQIQTAVVEGTSDRKFLSQWITDTTKIRFDGFNGKELVNNAFIEYNSSQNFKDDFLYFFADIDFDVITNNPLKKHHKFIYNAFCIQHQQALFNDLETFLLNTNAFNKVLVNLDMAINNTANLRGQLERASRTPGSLRAADIIIKKKNKLSSSVLNGLNIETFFDPVQIKFDKEELFKALSRWTNYPEYIDDLIDEAERLDRDFPTAWSLSRGHDLTEMLALHLNHLGHKGMNASKLELMLRLSCELTDFLDSPMGKQFFRVCENTIIRSTV